MTAAAHVLILDDEPPIVRLCERLLQRAGFTTEAFVSASEALDYMRYHAIDLLLVDIRMPERSGFDVIAEVQHLQPEAAILVMTGFGTVEIAIQALKQGVDGLILKPFENTDELVQATRQALADKQRKRDAARIQVLRPLFDVTETLLSETQYDRLLALIIQAVCGHLRCEHAAFYQRDAKNGRWKALAGEGKPLPEEAASQDGLIERVVAQGAPLLVSRSGPGEAEWQMMLEQAGLESVLCAPVLRSNVRGVLYAARSAGQPGFGEADWEMFLVLARQAAVALENACLYAELRDYVRRMEESQQALIRAEKMAAAGRLTASIAHEINNPLQAVQNCVHLAARSELPAERREEYLRMAQNELDRLMNIIQRMLDFYRPGNIKPQVTEVGELIHYVLELLTPQLERRGIRVTTTISPRLPPVMAVSSQIQQVFLNLILNAYDAMPEGGELKITARRREEMVEILFQDTGPGVPPEYRERIFEPFVSTKKGGLGLGLSVSCGIIEAHGGNLDLLSEMGPGACFRVMLPAKERK
jgi:signal transduction histidine kinase